MQKPDEVPGTPGTAKTAEPVNLDAELHRWYGNLLSQLEPKVTPAVFATLDEGRLNLSRILNAASAARP